MRFTLSCFLNFLRMFVGQFSVFTWLIWLIRRCVGPGLVNVLIKFSQGRGPQTLAIMKESIVNHDVNSFDLFPVLL